MAAVKHLIGLRNDIDDLVNESFRLNEGAVLSKDYLLKEVKRRLRKQIAAAESHLLDMALKQLIDSIGRRKAGRRSGLGQRDLFGGYANIPQIVTIGGKRTKPTSTLSIREAQNYLDAHSPRAVSERYEAFKRLVADCLPFRTSDDDTIEVLLARKRAHDAGGKSAFAWTAESPTSSTSMASKEEPALAK